MFLIIYYKLLFLLTIFDYLKVSWHQHERERERERENERTNNTF